MSLRLTPAVRLHSRAEFVAVERRGRRVSTKHFTIVGSPNGLLRDRLGIIASRRFGIAVKRNRAKRRIREIFRKQHPDSAALTIARAFDLVVIARGGLLAAPFPVLEAELVGAIEKLRKGKIS